MKLFPGWSAMLTQKLDYRETERILERVQRDFKGFKDLEKKDLCALWGPNPFQTHSTRSNPPGRWIVLLGTLKTGCRRRWCLKCMKENVSFAGPNRALCQPEGVTAPSSGTGFSRGGEIQFRSSRRTRRGRLTGNRRARSMFLIRTFRKCAARNSKARNRIAVNNGRVYEAYCKWSSLNSLNEDGVLGFAKGY